MEKRIKELYKKVLDFRKGSKHLALPSDCYYLEQDLVLVTNPIDSGARFPYASDGLTIWAHAAGYISINKSSFYIAIPVSEGKGAVLDFFASFVENGVLKPFSILGPSQNKNDECKRFTIFSKNFAYYFTETSKALFCVEVSILKSNIYFTHTVINLTNKKLDVALSSYMNLLFKHDNAESIETRWFKKVSFYGHDTFIYESPEDINRHTRLENYGVVRRVYSQTPMEITQTTSRIDFVGAKNKSLANADALWTGTFKKNQKITHFTDTAINGDILRFDILDPVTVGYKISIANSKETLQQELNTPFTYQELLDVNSLLEKDNTLCFGDFNISFNGSSFGDDLLNEFIKFVCYQVHFSSLSSNSGTVFLGVRDVAQQLEASLIWDRENARKKIIEVVSFLDPSGIAPRQYSLPPDGKKAKMDLREFIDQGLWLISLVHTYISFTKDYSLLDVECPFFERGDGFATVTSYSTSIRNHLERICDFLIRNIDEKTHCLHALYGDWNDALDGLGLKENSNEYGTGVSVMATLQLYECLNYMQAIIKDDSYLRKCLETRKILRQGLIENGLVKQNNITKILHGWGNEKSYFVGSFNDPDNKSRVSLTSNAFFVISKLIKEYPNLKESIIEAFKSLDSKYGLKTFEPYFENFHGFGRIINLPKGTAENAATYVHATLFGILALYMLGEGKAAYTQLYKILPLTHSHISTSPFIMSNSYSYNSECNMDGESMSDWYTGSANTLIKTLMKGLFGVNIDINTMTIEPSNYLFASISNLSFTLGQNKINIELHKSNEYVFYVNGVLIESQINEVSNQKFITIDLNTITTDLTIVIK